MEDFFLFFILGKIKGFVLHDTWRFWLVWLATESSKICLGMRMELTSDGWVELGHHSLIQLYSICGKIKLTCFMFDEMLEKCVFS